MYPNHLRLHYTIQIRSYLSVYCCHPLYMNPALSIHLPRSTIKFDSALRMRVVSAVNRTTFPPEGTYWDCQIMYRDDSHCTRIWSWDPENMRVMGLILVALLEKSLIFFLIGVSWLVAFFVFDCLPISMGKRRNFIIESFLNLVVRKTLIYKQYNEL